MRRGLYYDYLKKKCPELRRILDKYNFHYCDSIVYPNCVCIYSHLLVMNNIMTEEDYKELMKYKYRPNVEYVDYY